MSFLFLNSAHLRHPKSIKKCLTIIILKKFKKNINCRVDKIVDLIEQNQCYFWIQYIKIILNQLKNAKQ